MSHRTVIVEHDYTYSSVEECVAAGEHSQYVDRDGYCNLCGDSPVEDTDCHCGHPECGAC
jgi:hypothetical protein